MLRISLAPSAAALLPRPGGLRLHVGLILWLLLLACGPGLPRAVAGGQPTLPPTALQPDSRNSKEDVVLTASKLSPRLRLLADWATTGRMPVDVAEQARQLGLAESGAGSLSRDAAGHPIVDVRVRDTSAETIAALTALPADVLSIAPEYATITLAIAPERLNDLARIDAVQYAGEVIRPGGSSSPDPFGELPGGGIAPSAP